MRKRPPRLIVLLVVAAVAIGAAVAIVLRPWEGDTIHAEPSLTDPQLILTYDETGVREAAETASDAVGFPVRPADASSIGLTVKAIRIDPIRTDPPRDATGNPRRAVAIYQEAAADPKDPNRPYTGLGMQITYLHGRWDTGPASDDDGNAIEALVEMPFDVAGYTLLRVTSLESPDQSAAYHLISDAATFVVRVGYDGELAGRTRPSDSGMLPILRALAVGE